MRECVRTLTLSAALRRVVAMSGLGSSVRPWLRRGLLAAVAVAVVVPLVTASGATPAPYPGLPGGDGQQWTGVGQRGHTISERAQQAFWLPGNVVTADLNVGAVRQGTAVTTTTTARVFFVSPADSQRAYGELRPFPVRTMAFGIIPIEATVHLSQQVAPDGLPVPITLRTQETNSGGVGGVITAPDTTVTADLDVRLDGLTMDGQPVDLGPGCRTAEPAKLDLVGKGFRVLASQRGPLLSTPDFYRQNFTAGAGGRLQGNVTIPAFSGCGVAEDISALITNAISGPDNPVLLQLTGPNCNGAEARKGVAPGDGDRVEACFPATISPQLRAAKQVMDELALPTG